MWVSDIVCLLAFNAIGDFALQSEYMAKEKHNHLFVMYSHCLLWTLSVSVGFYFVCGHIPSLPALLFLFVGHWALDRRNHPDIPQHLKGKTFDFDYLFHLLQIVAVYVSEVCS